MIALENEQKMLHLQDLQYMIRMRHGNPTQQQTIIVKKKNHALKFPIFYLLK
jgi:hypothetical protein